MAAVLESGNARPVGRRMGGVLPAEPVFLRLPQRSKGSMGFGLLGSALFPAARTGLVNPLLSPLAAGLFCACFFRFDRNNSSCGSLKKS